MLSVGCQTVLVSPKPKQVPWVVTELPPESVVLKIETAKPLVVREQNDGPGIVGA